MSVRTLRSILGLATAVSLCILFLAPATGWLLRRQAGAQIVPSFLEGNQALREKRFVEAHPRDYPIQLAYALTVPQTPEPQTPSYSTFRIRRLTELAIDFPNEPTVYAHLLRYYATGTVRVTRTEQNELSPEPPVNSGPRKASTDADLAAFDAAAANGERLEPDNAYFPLMRAVGLFEANRDAEAIAAVHRAGQKTRYEDYANSEFGVEDRFYTEVYGHRGAIARTTQAASILFPQYAQIRAVARMSVVSAAHYEQAGQREEGFALRQDTMRAGGLMRVQGHSLICNFVGIAVSTIPISRPGGVPAIKIVGSENWNEAQKAQHTQKKKEKYFAYLRDIGHPEAARWAQAELEAGARVKQISGKASESETGPFSMKPLIMTAVFWLADLLTLSNALGLLVLGLAAGFAARIRSEHDLFTNHLNLWRGLLCAATLVVMGFWLANVQSAAHNWGSAPLQMVSVMQSTDSGGVGYGERGETLLGSQALALTLPLALPILLVVSIVIVSLKSHAPLAETMGRWLRGLAMPMACALFLLYSGLLLGTVRQEAQMNANLEKQVAHEGRNIASYLGQCWPGLIP